MRVLFASSVHIFTSAEDKSAAFVVVCRLFSVVGFEVDIFELRVGAPVRLP